MGIADLSDAVLAFLRGDGEARNSAESCTNLKIEGWLRIGCFTGVAFDSSVLSVCFVTGSTLSLRFNERGRDVSDVEAGVVASDKSCDVGCTSVDIVSCGLCGDAVELLFEGVVCADNVKAGCRASLDG